MKFIFLWIYRERIDLIKIVSIVKLNWIMASVIVNAILSGLFRDNMNDNLFYLCHRPPLCDSLSHTNYYLNNNDCPSRWNSYFWLCRVPITHLFTFEWFVSTTCMFEDETIAINWLRTNFYGIFSEIKFNLSEMKRLSQDDLY